MSIPFQKFTKIKGLHLEKIPAQKIIFRDQQSWDSFWAEYGEGTVAEIDFSNYMLIGVFLGKQANPEYGVEIIGINKSDSSILVYINNYLPNPEYDYPSVLAYPYDIVYFPKVEGEFEFIKYDKIRE